MKTLIALFLILSTSVSAADRFESRSRELFRKTHQIQLDLNPLSVRCSDVGYGNVQLKINVDALEYLSFFDHSNPGEVAPCMTAGAMSCVQNDIPTFPLPPLNGPETLLDEATENEADTLTRFRSLGKVTTQLEQVLTEKYYLDLQEQTCRRSIEEIVETEVDGTLFSHFRTGNLGEYPYDICLQL